MMLRCLPLALLALLASCAPLAAQTATKTRHVILVMPDGLRWQEVFRGADERLMGKEHGLVEDERALKERYWRGTPEARREAIMPFLWSVIAEQGQVFGNRDKGSDARVTNGVFVSYPGYSETLCGFADPTIDSNRKIPNRNATVFEWLHGMPEFRGRVAAFGAWDVFPFIFNTARCGFPVDDSIEPVAFGTMTPTLNLLNRLRAETPRRWGGHFDALLYHSALEWFKTNRPRLLFLCLGETDEWAHEGRYDRYLEAASRADGYCRELWEWCQADPEYRGTTTMVIVTDHGRGDFETDPRDWNSHGVKHPGSENIWIAVIGPDTPALGERADCGPVTQSQVAATIAALLGKDYVAAEPRAGGAIGDVLPPK